MNLMPARRASTGLALAMLAIASVSAFNVGTALAADGQDTSTGTTVTPDCLIPVDPIGLREIFAFGDPGSTADPCEEPPIDCPVPEPVPMGEPGSKTDPDRPDQICTWPPDDCLIYVDPLGGSGGTWESPPSPGEPVPPVIDCPIPDPIPGDGATHVVPTPGIVDAQPVAIDHISVSADGLTVTVYWWGGARGCYGLADATATRDASGALVITVTEGALPGREDMACIAIAMLLATDIVLDQPIFTDGSGN